MGLEVLLTEQNIRHSISIIEIFRKLFFDQDFFVACVSKNIASEYFIKILFPSINKSILC